jgi:putative FmdB family regulatory protein
MPLYEYTCQSCQHPFEALVFAGDTPQCPQCHSTTLQRLMSLPAAPREETPASACRSEGPPCGPVCGRWGK